MILTEKDGVCFCTSPILPCPHGFSTRLGGVSTAPHTKSLNLAFHRGDDEETVMKNLGRFSEAIGIDPATVFSPPQIHSADVQEVRASDAGYGYTRSCDFSCDGSFTFEKGVALGVKTADCVPILLAGLSEDGRAIAVSALHAGWRGSAGKIAEHGVRALLERGIPKERIRAAIGPSIGQCCYEVGEELREAFLPCLGSDGVEKTFQKSEKLPGKYRLDLKEANRMILLSCGLLPSQIDVSEFCTACHPELFYSHRYSNGIRGSMLSLISL